MHATATLLTLSGSCGLLRTVERALSFGATSAIAWDLAEYFAFISRTSERTDAYGDPLGDHALGTAGAVVGGMAVHHLRQQGWLLDPAAVSARERVQA